MWKMRIALFTPFSPEIGGGSVQLRSHIEQMPGLDVVWYFLANAPAHGENWQWLGKQLLPAQFASDLSARTGFFPGSTAPVKNLVKRLDADLYWVVAHYEGMSVAAELLSRGKRVHLTVHDEPLGMIIRSRRYRSLYPLVSHIFKKVLLGAVSVDVTSWGMRDYFKSKYGLNCFSLYRSLSNLPHVNFAPDSKLLRVGHIGSLYRPDPFRKFVAACRQYATEQHRELRILRIGDSPEMDKIAGEHPEIFQNLGEMEESAAIPLLANCNFLYAMYPDGFRYQRFRRTSLPIKLSTYIQAQRPIFAHSPGDSNMAKIVSEYQVGRLCSSEETIDLKNTIAEVLSSNVSRAQFEFLRNDLMGEGQVEQLRRALTQEA
jgi:hypothetical protein